METMTITHLARNLADVVNRVLYRGERFVVVRGNRPVVELSPPPLGRRLGDLPGVLATLPRLDSEDAEAMAAELDAARDELGVTDGDPWHS